MYDITYADRLDRSDLYVYECGTQHCDPGYTYGPAIRNFFVLHYIHAGKGNFRLGKREYNLGESDAFLICPGILTQYSADHSLPWEYSWIGFHGALVEEFLSSAGLNVASPVIQLGKGGFQEGYFRQMMKAPQMPKAREAYLTGLLYQLLSNYIVHMP